MLISAYRHNFCPLTTLETSAACSMFVSQETAVLAKDSCILYWKFSEGVHKTNSFARHSWMIGKYYSTTKKVQDCLLNSLIMLVGVTLPSSMVKVAEVVLHRYGDSTNSSWVCVAAWFM